MSFFPKNAPSFSELPNPTDFFSYSMSTFPTPSHSLLLCVSLLTTSCAREISSLYETFGSYWDWTASKQAKLLKCVNVNWPWTSAMNLFAAAASSRFNFLCPDSADMLRWWMDCDCLFLCCFICSAFCTSSNTIWLYNNVNKWMAERRKKHKQCKEGTGMKKCERLNEWDCLFAMEGENECDEEKRGIRRRRWKILLMLLIMRSLRMTKKRDRPNGNENSFPALSCLCWNLFL